MKLQVQRQALRVRVTEAELKDLLAGSPLRLDLRFSGQRMLTLELTTGPETSVQPGDIWRVRLSETALQDYAGTLPRRDALVAALTGTGGEPLRLEFEVDVRDSVKVRGARKGGAG
jgi:hypothetical protein